MKLNGNKFSGRAELPYRLSIEQKGICFKMNMNVMNHSGDWIHLDRCIYLQKEGETETQAKEKLIKGSQEYFGIELIKKEELTLSKTA